MKYVCLVYHEEEKLRSVSEEELDSIIRGCGEWVQELERAGRHVYSSGLQSIRSATTLRMRDGKLNVTDGPFAETKEFLGGFTILEAQDLNDAIAVASRLPGILVGTVEVRPLLDGESESLDPLDQKVLAAVRRAHRVECGH